MGVSYDHTVSIHFTNYDDCERYYNYLTRWIVKNKFTRQYGFDRECDTEKSNWKLYSMFELGFDDDTAYIEFDIDSYKNTVTLNSGGYNNIPQFLISYALEFYKADSLYLQLRGLQCQDESNIEAVYNYEQDDIDVLYIPDWAM